MTTKEKQAAYARQWRAANLERSREISRKAQAKRRGVAKRCGADLANPIFTCCRLTRHTSGLCHSHRK